MSKWEKAKKRIKDKPRDYTYSEARALLGHMGFKEYQKGRTSGSRVKFFRAKDEKVVLLHKPHPGDIMDRGAVADLADYLTSIGEL